MHMGEHERDEAYGFSIFSADQGRFMGLLSVHPVAPFLDNSCRDPQAVGQLNRVDTRVEYWLRRGADRASNWNSCVRFRRGCLRRGDSGGWHSVHGAACTSSVPGTKRQA